MAEWGIIFILSYRLISFFILSIYTNSLIRLRGQIHQFFIMVNKERLERSLLNFCSQVNWFSAVLANSDRRPGLLVSVIQDPYAGALMRVYHLLHNINSITVPTYISYQKGFMVSWPTTVYLRSMTKPYKLIRFPCQPVFGAKAAAIPAFGEPCFQALTLLPIHVMPLCHLAFS